MLVFDIESDGLLDTITVIHCINIIDRRTGKRYAFNGGVYKDGTPCQRDGTVEDGVRMLQMADRLCGQNIIWYDIPAIKKIYPWFNPQGKLRDTKVEASVIWTDLADVDFGLLASGKLPEEFRKQGLIGANSLKAWGYRLGEFKGDFDPKDYINPETGEKHTWKTIGFTREMDEYGRQDPEVTLKFIEKIDSKNYSTECLELENEVSEIVFRQHERGFCVDMDAINALVAKLQRRHAEISGELQKVFKPWWAPKVTKGTAVFTPKRDNRKEGYVAGAPFSKVHLLVFNPASRAHIAGRLKKLRGWRPTTFTPSGDPQVDESTLEPLPWPEAKLLVEYLLVEKRLGQAATGDKSWLRFATKKGIYGGPEGKHWRIHGRVNTNGATTGRMTHTDPNIAQVPRIGTPYGEESRSCFVATPGLVLMGCDAEGIEMRLLAHFMARYDDGAYADAVVNGDKSKGTDAHSLNKKALTFNSRDNSKTFLYAMLYGAQGYKLGTITYDDFTDEQKAAFNAKYPTSKKRARDAALKRLGENRKARLMTNLPALGQLVAAVDKAVRERGRLIGLDGRVLKIRGAHAALNTLCQSAGAVVMKRALVMFDKGVAADVRSAGGTVGYVANVHDEIQTETEEKHAETIGAGFAGCIKRAGEHYKLRCPLAGSHGIGSSWKSTH